MHVVTLARSLPEVEVDLLAVGLPEERFDEALKAADPAFGPELACAAAGDEFKPKAGKAVTYPTFGRWKAPWVALVGTGKGTLDDLRQAAGQAGLLARGRGSARVGLALGALTEEQATAVVEAFGAGNYRFDKYKPTDERKAPSGELVLVGDVAKVDAARAAAVVAAQSFARDLVNEPAAEVYPESLARACRDLADDHLSVEVWDEVRIKAEGMGGITAVGQGSARPARFIHMHYRSDGEPTARIALVGKGVTFDAGGLSIKPSSGMQTMRCDMAGSAAVIGAMRAIRDLRPGVEVHGIVGAVENLVSGTSYKLGDVLRMYNGKTVEIHNTDAEGRLVLADCLAYASRLGVDHVVDLATLTGACVVALGDHYNGLFTFDDTFAQTLLGKASDAGEYLWRLPMPDWYKDQLKADWGAIKNVGSRNGGAITAALFLSEFVEGVVWAHVDIAGPAFLEKPWRHFVSGATGAMIPTLVRWIAG